MNNMKLNINMVKVLLISTALLLSTNNVHANVGKVIYDYGNNYALDTDGNRRDLKKGDVINEGDTLVTGKGRMHIRLIDGGFVSVYPNSEYRIDKFRYSGKKKTDKTSAVDDKKEKQAVESKEDKGFFSLLRGAARQVTGLLGRTHKENFKFKTAVATIGIRGTGFFARLCQADCFDIDGNPLQDGLHVKNNTGIITVKNNAGEVSLAQGQSAFAASSEDQPQQTVQPPIARNLVAPDIELYDFDEKILDVDQEIEVGTGPPVQPPVDPPVTPTVVVTKMEYVTSDDVSFPATFGGIDTANVTDSVQQTGDVIDHFQGIGVYIDSGVLVFDQAAATLEESGTDAALGVLWNRWSSGYTFTEGGTDVPQGTQAGNDIHLIGSDNITPSIAGLTGTVTYTGTGGTSPTITGFAGDQVGTQVMSATINYGASEVTSFNLDLTFTNATINVIKDPSPTFLSGTSGIPVVLSGSCFGTGCTVGTGAFIQGEASVNLVGPNAEGIYGVYNLVTTETGRENAISGSYLAK